MMTPIEQSLTDYLGGYTRNNPARDRKSVV